MDLLKRKPQKDAVIGIPRGLNFDRDEFMWREFFHNLGIKTKISEETTIETLTLGQKHVSDDTCLSMKIFMGHVASLIGQCDYIFIPRIVNYGIRLESCTRFSALYDIVRNEFKMTGQQFLSFSIDMIKNEKERDAFISLGQKLGFSLKESFRVYKKAKKTDISHWKELILNERKKIRRYW